MNKTKVNRIIINTLLFTITFCFALLDTIINITNGGDGIVFAAETDEITFDGSTYNEESEYFQYCLNRLGYRDSDNSTLDTDGHFGNKSKSALDKFLESQGFSYFSATARDKLMSQAESTANESFNSGFTLGSNKLLPTAFIYSSVSNINNSNDPFYSMSMLKNFQYIITMKPDEMSYKSKRVIDIIKTDTKTFGYVNLGPNNPTANANEWKLADLNKVKAEIDSIANAGWYGVFIDQFGYDWNETRERQNIIVDHIHSKGLIVMVNAWFVDDAFGSKIDKVANSQGTTPHLNSNDWYLIESFFTDGTSYRGDASYIEKYLKVKQYKDSMKINVTVLSYKRDSTTWQQATNDVKNSYILAQCLGFNGWWFGKTDNSDNLLFGSDPNVDLGAYVKQLELKSKNIYVAETEKYTIEYYAQTVPTINLIPKKR